MYEYQEAYSSINPAVLDMEGRVQKARKIQSVINDYTKKKGLSGIILDFGCSGSIILNYLSIQNSEKIGIDIDLNALTIARSNPDIFTINFICADGMHLPFRDDTIGLTICNHIYEHLPDSALLFREIYRTLKPESICYCAAGNRLSIMEGHYHLPFLSWLPKPIAHLYLKITHKGDYYYEKHLTWWELKKQI